MEYGGTRFFLRGSHRGGIPRACQVTTAVRQAPSLCRPCSAGLVGQIRLMSVPAASPLIPIRSGWAGLCTRTAACTSPRRRPGHPEECRHRTGSRQDSSGYCRNRAYCGSDRRQGLPAVRGWSLPAGPWVQGWTRLVRSGYTRRPGRRVHRAGWRYRGGHASLSSGFHGSYPAGPYTTDRFLQIISLCAKAEFEKTSPFPGPGSIRESAGDPPCRMWCPSRNPGGFPLSHQTEGKAGEMTGNDGEKKR